MGDLFRRMGWAALLILATVAVAIVPASAVAAKKASCKGAKLLAGSEESRLPAELEGSLEAPVLAQYAVFRRAQLPGDQLPPVNPAADVIGRSLSGYYPTEIRQLASLPSGERFYVVAGLPRTVKLARPECVPKGLLKLFEKENAKATEPRFCIIATGVGLSGLSEGCLPFGEAASSDSVFGLFASEATALLVPDGVATVRIVGPGTRTQTLPVSENAYVYAPPPGVEKEQGKLFRELAKLPKIKHPTKAQRRRLERRTLRALVQVGNRTRPSRIEWLGPGGQLVKTIKRPPGLGGGGLTTLVVSLLTAA